MKKILFTIFLSAVALTALAADEFVSFAAGDWQLNANGSVTIYVSDKDERGVMRAAKDLVNDLKAVTGHAGVLVDNPKDAAIIIGTAGKVEAVKSYAKQLKGKYEMYVIEAADSKLTIAGSNRRGTIFGIYELSRQLGVSPWYYWADVPTMHHDKIYIKNGSYTDGEPAVKWNRLR